MLSKELLPYVPNLLVTLGEYGALMIKQTQVRVYRRIIVNVYTYLPS